MSEMERLWSCRELAAYLRYSESTIARMVSRHPEKLPPRVASLGRPRWDPEIVRQWVRDSSRPRAKVGRPRAIAG
jgi:predicted DNA-binding transcriptional regulator AlpA